MTLALLYLTTYEDKYSLRAWKNLDWDTMNRLFEKGYISNPVGKNKYVAFTETGANLSEELFKKFFTESE